MFSSNFEKSKLKNETKELKTHDIIFFEGLICWSCKNFTKSSTPPHVFFTLLKLYKWYQTAQLSLAAACTQFIQHNYFLLHTCKLVCLKTGTLTKKSANISLLSMRKSAVLPRFTWLCYKVLLHQLLNEEYFYFKVLILDCFLIAEYKQSF